MSTTNSREKVKTAIWKAIAQSEIDLSALSKSDLEVLVDLVTDATLIEIDRSIDETLSADDAAKERFYPPADEEGEQVLWKGRPFLSISEHYVITSERIRIIEGLLGKRKQDVELIRVQDIDQTQTLRERTLNLGDIYIRSHDSDAPTIVLNNVRDPEQVQDILRRAVQDARKRYKITFQEEM